MAWKRWVTFVGPVVLGLAMAGRSDAILQGGAYRVAEGALVEGCGSIAFHCAPFRLQGRIELAIIGQAASIDRSSLTLSLPGGPPFPFPAPEDLALSELEGVVSDGEIELVSPAGSTQTARLTLQQLGEDLVLDGVWDEGCCDRYVFELTRIRLIAERSVAGTHTLHWQDRFGPSLGDTFRRPDASGTQIADLQPVPYSALSVFVEESGIYEIESDQDVFEPFDGMLLLYGPRFDPVHPLDDLLAINDDDGPSASRIVAPLAAGVIYRVVTTFVSPPSDLFDIDNRITGPGRIHFSACFLDEPLRSDDNVDLSLRNERFCASVRWNDGRGGSGRARPAGHRSDESGLFWFFEPDNWELQVKILDGCAENGHYWLLLSGSTDVGLSLEIRDHLGGNAPYRYESQSGSLAGTFIDIEALSCD